MKKISPHDHPFQPDPHGRAEECSCCGCLEGTHGKSGSLGFREKLRQEVGRISSQSALWHEGFDDKLRDEAVSAILKLIREEIVPPEASPLPKQKLSKGSVGWNQCREAMLRKIGGEQ